jgi:pilus assembly protein Flp/PilA
MGTPISGKGGDSMLRPFASRTLQLVLNEDEDGQTLVEYGLLLALIAIVVFLALLFLGPVISEFFMDTGDTIIDIT